MLEVVIEIIPLDFQLQVPFGLAIRTHQVVDTNKYILHCWTSLSLDANDNISWTGLLESNTQISKFWAGHLE